MMSPPYAHLPTSITTSHSVDPSATTTTRHMPPIGSTNGSFIKTNLGWKNTEGDGEYLDAFQNLLLDGWVITERPLTGDICLGTIWMSPPSAVSESH